MRGLGRMLAIKDGPRARSANEVRYVNERIVDFIKTRIIDEVFDSE